MAVLLGYHWPGNIREMKNCLERAAIITDNEPITPQHLIVNAAGRQEEGRPAGVRAGQIGIDLDAADTSLDSLVEKILQATLDKCEGNKSRAAEILKVNRKMFYRR